MSVGKREKTKIEFYEQCSKCGKEITGGSESHVKYNLRIHMDAEHNIPLQDGK